MAVRYPLGLRTIVSASKIRKSDPVASLAMPRRGMGFLKPVANIPPSEWEVSFFFDAAEKRVFLMWFLSPDYCDRGRAPFTINIRTESGNESKTVIFLPDSLLPATQQGECMSYTAKLREVI